MDPYLEFSNWDSSWELDTWSAWHLLNLRKQGKPLLCRQMGIIYKEGVPPWPVVQTWWPQLGAGFQRPSCSGWSQSDPAGHIPLTGTLCIFLALLPSLPTKDAAQRVGKLTLQGPSSISGKRSSQMGLPSSIPLARQFWAVCHVLSKRSSWTWVPVAPVPQQFQSCTFILVSSPPLSQSHFLGFS